MRKLIFSFLLAVGLFSIPSIAGAQIKFGPKVGISMASYDYNKGENISSKTGFTVGGMLEYISPWHGLGFDIAVMYERRRSNWEDIDKDGSNNSIRIKDLNYFNIPVNLKWKYSLPLVGIFVTVGPQLSFPKEDSFITSNRDIKRNSTEFGFNVGAGVELFKSFQISATHYWATNPILENTSIKGKWKARVWTIGAAYLF